MATVRALLCRVEMQRRLLLSLKAPRIVYLVLEHKIFVTGREKDSLMGTEGGQEQPRLQEVAGPAGTGEGGHPLRQPSAMRWRLLAQPRVEDGPLLRQTRGSCT